MRQHFRTKHFWLSAIVAVLVGTGLFFSSSRWLGTAGPTQYSDVEFPVRVTLPSGWTATRNESGTGDGRIMNVVFSSGASGATLIIAPKTLTNLIRQSSQARSATLRVFENGDRVYVLNGQADFVDTIGASVTFY